MLTYKEPRPEDWPVFLALMREKTGGYLEPTLRMMGMSWEEFGQMFRTVGQVRVIEESGNAVGFVWTEQRDRVLHVHGLVLEPDYRGRGIGTKVFLDLERQARGNVDLVELGVHETNSRARALYERLGFRVTRSLPGVGFTILQKAVAVPRVGSQ